MSNSEKPAIENASNHESDGSFDDDDDDAVDARRESETKVWFQIFPRSDFEPAAVGREISWELRKAALLYSNADIDDLFNNPEMWPEVFGLQSWDEELFLGLGAALSCIGDLHQFGRVTAPGLGVGAIKTFMKNNAHFERYFATPGEWPRPSAVVQAEIDERMPALRRLREELEAALQKETAAAGSKE